MFESATSCAEFTAAAAPSVARATAASVTKRSVLVLKCILEAIIAHLKFHSNLMSKSGSPNIRNITFPVTDRPAIPDKTAEPGREETRSYCHDMYG